jgi:hypothetical protein
MPTPLKVSLRLISKYGSATVFFWGFLASRSLSDINFTSIDFLATKKILRQTSKKTIKNDWFKTRFKTQLRTINCRGDAKHHIYKSSERIDLPILILVIENLTKLAPPAIQFRRNLAPNQLMRTMFWQLPLVKFVVFSPIHR